MDVARGEGAAKELEAMLVRRAWKGDVDPDEREALWQASVRRYNARRREENRCAWHDYFERLAACLRARAAEYDHRAQTLMESEREETA